MSQTAVRKSPDQDQLGAEFGVNAPNISHPKARLCYIRTELIYLIVNWQGRIGNQRKSVVFEETEMT